MRKDSPVGKLVLGVGDSEDFKMLCLPMFWLPKAAELYRSAEILFTAWQVDIAPLRAWRPDSGVPDPDLPPNTITTAFFLAALAIENLLKAALVRNDPSVVSGGKLGKQIKHHDLVKLATDAGVSLDEDEREFCQHAREAIANFGRYPVGLSASTSPGQVTVKSRAFPIFHKFYERLRVDLKANPMPKPWSGSTSDQ